jgi:hypothetical protein
VRASSIVAVIAVLSLAGVELLPVHRTTYGIQGFVLGSRSLVGVVGAFMENFAHAAVVLFGIWMIVRLRPGVAAGLFISGGILRFVGLVWQGTLYSAHIETSSGYVVDLVSITAAFLAAAFAVRAREPYASGAPPTPPSAPDVFLGGHASEVTDPSLG